MFKFQEQSAGESTQTNLHPDQSELCTIASWCSILQNAVAEVWKVACKRTPSVTVTQNPEIESECDHIQCGCVIFNN